MKILINDKFITLEVGDYNLKKYQTSQLHFYGFKGSQESYQKESSDIPHDLKKIIKYLDLENLKYEISNDACRILEEINSKQENLKELRKLGGDIKDGKINKDHFDTFLTFLYTLPRRLKSHQVKAAYHLYSVRNGANFSVPGSGKTSVVLAVYEKLRIEGLCNMIFVAGPPSSFQPWQNEFEETLGRDSKATILSGGNKDIRKSEYYRLPGQSEMYLSSFQTIMNDYKDLLKFFRQHELQAFMVVDEAHYMKQIGGRWADALLQASEPLKYKCILTGTPIPKSYKDLFNLFDFLMPGLSPLSEEDKMEIALFEKNKKNKEVKKLLHNRIGSFFYRVRKKDLGLTPANFHDPNLIRMNKIEFRIYELLKAKIFELSQDEFLENSEILSNLWKGRMIRMRQATSYPKLLLGAIENYKEDLIGTQAELSQAISEYDKNELPGKLEFLTALVGKLRKDNLKVVIWSNFIGTLKLITSHFSRMGWKSKLIYGRTPRRNDLDSSIDDELTREGIRDEFVKPNSGLDILIANPAACAESISLHKTCFHSIYYDLSYNCAQYLQSLDRIHRVGGSEDKEANYYFLQYENSLDQDIKENLDLKAQKMYSIIEQDYEIYNLDMGEDLINDDEDAYKRLFVNKQYEK
ncbi:DEAD/DEAH box helicase [Reichenbachiella sp.]|uniref:DEAD/DEAH box helicase n=1 Tax=Reichenbachiella sp. TaxID=2184521 RepID=UPI003297B132